MKPNIIGRSAQIAVAASLLSATSARAAPIMTPQNSEQQITFHSGGHILTNANVWSPDGKLGSSTTCAPMPKARPSTVVASRW